MLYQKYLSLCPRIIQAQRDTPITKTTPLSRHFLVPELLLASEFLCDWNFSFTSCVFLMLLSTFPLQKGSWMCHRGKQCLDGEKFVLWTLELIPEKKNPERGLDICVHLVPAQCWHCVGAGEELGFWQPGPISALFLVPY